MLLKRIILIAENNQKTCHLNYITGKGNHPGEDPEDRKMNGAETGLHVVEVHKGVVVLLFQEEVDKD